MLMATLVVFGGHLFGNETFIGDSDRLNSYLNMRLFQYDGIRDYGRVPLWNDRMFTGLSMAGLHWMNPVGDPIPWVLALFPRDEVFRVLGWLSALSVFLAMAFAFLYLRDLTRLGTPALTGAILYGLSVFSIHRAAQVDNAHMTLVILPLGLLAIRRSSQGATLGYFVVLALALSLLLLHGFLQEAAYLMIYLAGFALYRSGILARRGRNDCLIPLAVFCLAALAAVIISAPRLLTVAEDLQLLSRTQTFHYTDIFQIFRLLHEGLLGRYQGEGRALGNGTNLHEGLQLLGSSIAVLIVIVGISRPATIAQLSGALVFAAILGIVPTAIVLFQIFEFGPVWGSRSWDAFLVNLCGLGVLVTAAAAAIDRRGLASSTSDLFRRWVPERYRSDDTTFHLWVLAIALMLVFVEEIRFGLYELFGRIDFTHSRVSLLATMSLAALFAIYIRGFATLANTQADSVQTKAASVTAMLAAGLLGFVVNGAILDRLLPGEAWTVVGLLNGNVLLKLAITGSLALISSMLFFYCWRAKRMAIAGVILAVVCGYAAGETVGYARYKIAGEHTETYPLPFRSNNYMTVKPRDLRPPENAKVTAVSEWLENDRYRSVLISKATEFPSNNAPHISQFWKLRLLGGYSAGIPSRLAGLPWPSGAAELRSIEFRTPEQLPGQLLTLLNVKYAVLLNKELYFNSAETDGPVITPRLFENPDRPLPRHYLAQSLESVATIPTVTAHNTENGPPVGLAARAVAGGGLLLSWSMSGAGDARQIEVYRRKPNSTERQLVATLGPSAQSFLYPALGKDNWIFELRSCGQIRCTGFSDPLPASAASLDAPPPALHTARMKPLAPGLLHLSLEPRNAGVIVIEGRKTAGDRFSELARLQPGETQTNIKIAAGTASVFLRARLCQKQRCSTHSEERLFLFPGATWRAQQSDDHALLFNGRARNLLARPLVESFGNVPGEGFDTSGTVVAQYRGERIDIAIEPSAKERFLVINELYHPAWRAYSQGREITILPTNVVMRGVRIPPGAADVKLRFEPFSASGIALLIQLLGSFLIAWGGWVLNRGSLRLNK